LSAFAAAGGADEYQAHDTTRPENGTGALPPRPVHTFPS
jgi:hypothetical protein